MSNSGTTVMPHNVECREAQMVHDRQLILRSRALAIDVQFHVAGLWLVAVAIATQVRRDHRVMSGQFRGNLVSLGVGLGTRAATAILVPFHRTQD